MTEKKANEIFRTKYPEGEIVRRFASSAGSKYFVVFKEGGKVYEYACTSYQQLLERFGFKIAYKHNIETAKANIKYHEEKLRKIESGEEKPFALFLGDSDEDAKAWEIEHHTKELNQWKEELRYLTEDCILG